MAQLALAIVGLVAKHKTTFCCRFVASVRAVWIDRNNSVAVDEMRLFNMNERMFGTAIPNKIAATARVNISSINVNPRGAVVGNIDLLGFFMGATIGVEKTGWIFGRLPAGVGGWAVRSRRVCDGVHT